MTKIYNSRFVAFGDSITFGAGVPEGATIWPQILKARFDLKMYNSGIGGNTIEQGVSRISSDVIEHKPDFVTICFGMNDHCMTGLDKPRVELEKFEKDLRKIIEVTKDINAIPILITTNYIIEGSMNEYYYSRHDPEFYKNTGGAQNWLDKYNAVTRKVAKELCVDLADVRAACEKHERYDFLRTLRNENFDDGVHPHILGQKVYAKTIGDLLEKIYG